MTTHRADTGHFDIDLAEVPPEVVGALAAQHLVVKGFCVLLPQFEADALEKAVKDAQGLDFYQVNEAVAEGLLGAEGSCRIADFAEPTDEELPGVGVGLGAMDRVATHIGYILQPHAGLGSFGFSCRSAAVLHRAGDAEEESPPLNEWEASKWQSQFLRHRLMVVIFLGPRVGSLELRPYGCEDAESHCVRTPPGIVVLLRPDVMSHRHIAPGGTYALSSFFMIDAVGKRIPDRGWHLVPAAQAIEDWTFARLRDLKELEEMRALDPDVPEPWRKAINHACHVGNRSGVAGLGTHQAGGYDAEQWFGASGFGPDYAREVPLTRWDHGEYYGPDPESWRQGKTYCRHGNFMEGIELFDNKFFNLLPDESRELDPHQRQLLEQGYNALAHMGLTKATLQDMPVGVYVGCETDEWSSHMAKRGIGSYGYQLCLLSGRFSFCLGLRGPSMTLAIEGASGLAASHMAAESLQKAGSALPSDFAVAIGVSLMLEPTCWVAQSMSGWLSRVGRCRTFDASADGYARGDCCAALAMKTAGKVVDGEIVPNSKEPLLASVSGSSMNNNGKAASLTAPHGPAEQECVAQAIRMAGVRPTDVDCVEAHAVGSALRDAVESATHRRAHRGDDGRQPLCLTASKSSVCNQIEAAGTTGLLRVVCSVLRGHMTPDLHLHLANPHIDVLQQPLALACERVDFPSSSSYSGVMAHGFGGTSVYVLTWGVVGSAAAAPEPIGHGSQMVYWPGGGGKLQSDKGPKEADSYFIVGTWTRWEVPQLMEKEGEGEYGFTVALGENCWEEFQIWLDGAPERALHPGAPRMPQGHPVLGPEPEFECGIEAMRSGAAPTWILDGRGGAAGYTKRPEAAGQAAEDASETAVAQTDAAIPMVGTTEAGLPGDQYRVLLEVKGKWRMVSWKKLPLAEQASLPAVAAGTYYLLSSWGSGELEEMQSDPSTPGLFTIQIQVPGHSGGDFQIVRDMDWGQVFYPNPEADVDGPDAILGPDAWREDLAWHIEGGPGDAFNVQFRRTRERGKESRSLTWHGRADAATDAEGAVQ